MKRVGLALFCFALGLLGAGLLLETSSPALADPPVPCDFKFASASTGSCGGPDGSKQCSSYNNQQYFCENAGPLDVYEVKQDFPLECRQYLKGEEQRTNCNMPDEDCYRKTLCTYDAKTGACTPTGTGVWTKKPKRTTVSCDAPPNK